MRTLALAAGARLVATGALARADDVFFLELEELEDASAGGGSFGIPVAERRRALARDTASPPPVVLGSTGDARSAPDDRPRLTLTGECAAPGVCRGTARVVHAPDDFAAFARGDVMIASYTDPGWTPILELACGLVLDAGGQLSHGAIVARELGIPALVNVTDATRAITTGDVVELDATAGTVRVVRRSREA
jgi:pyruvate,water dikinase